MCLHSPPRIVRRIRFSTGFPSGISMEAVSNLNCVREIRDRNEMSEHCFFIECVYLYVKFCLILSDTFITSLDIKKFFRSCYMSVYNRFAGHCRDGGGPVEIEMSAYIPADQNVNKAGPSSNTTTSMKSKFSTPPMFSF